MKGNEDRAGASSGGRVIVLLVLAMTVTAGITSASGVACLGADAADCRIDGGGSAAVESGDRAAVIGPAGIVGAPPWTNGPGGDGPPGKSGGDEGGEEEEEDEESNNRDSKANGEALGDGGDAARGSESGESSASDDSNADSDSPGNSGDASGQSAASAGRGGSAGDAETGDDAPGRSGDTPGRNGTADANAGDRGPPAAVPAAVNLTARGKSKGRGETVVNASVGEVRRNQRVSIDFDARRNALLNRSNASDVAISNIDLTPTRNGSFTMNLTTAERIEGSPEFETDDGTETLSHIRVNHSISNAEVNGTVDIGFEVSKARLANDSVAPEDVALYRYENGSWTELPTEAVGETNETVRFRAESPGLSEFAAGAKRPRFTVETVDVAVSEITVGDGVQVRVTVGNDGGADGEFLAQLILDGRAVEERSLTIAAGGQRRTLFDHAVADAGEYEVRVNDVVAGSVIVRRSGGAESTTGAETTEAATEPSVAGTGTAAPTVTGTDVASPLFHPTALVFAVLAALAARIRRR